jgi:hypothetical protein
LKNRWFKEGSGLKVDMRRSNETREDVDERRKVKNARLWDTRYNLEISGGDESLETETVEYGLGRGANLLDIDE